MFYHDDGIPNENAFVSYLVGMKNGETVKIPKGMRKRDAILCVLSAEPKTPTYFEIEKDVVYAYEDEIVKRLFYMEEGVETYIPITEMDAYRKAIRKMHKKRTSKFRINGIKLTVEI